MAEVVKITNWSNEVNWRTGGATAAGLPWDDYALPALFKWIRKCANDDSGIWHRAEFDDEVDRTKLMALVESKLTDKEIGDIMAWDDATVSRTRKSYVDETSIVVAIGKSIRRGLALNL